MEKIPIPIVENVNFTDLVSKISTKNTQNTEIDKTINEIVYQIVGLTEEEIEFIQTR